MKTLQQTIDSNFADPHYNALISDYATTADDFAGLDLYDIAHEIADGHEDVIYYNKAHALIARVSSDVESQATEQAHDCGGFDDKSYDEMATIIAYWIIHQETYEQMRNEVQELIAVLETYEEELSNYVADLDDECEVYIDKMETELSMTQDLISNLDDK